MTTAKEHSTRLIATLVLASAGLSQALEQGYANKVADLPSGAGQTLTIGTATVYFTGTELILQKGSNTRSLLQFSQSVFGSFTIRASSEALLFGESSNGGIWLVPLSANDKPKQLGTIDLNYSAVRYNQRWAIVSAKTGGFSAKDNDLIAIDLRDGTKDTIAVVPGASGPLTMGDGGDLYYATASLSFPPPAGSTDVVKFSAAKVRSAFGATQLSISDATTLYQGLDSAGAMAKDRDGDLFTSDWVNSEIVEINDVEGKAPSASTLASYSGTSLSVGGLEFVSAPASNTLQFEPFQPTGAGRLVVHETDFGATSRLRSVYSLRARAAASTGNRVPPASLFDLVVKDGMTSGTGFVLLGLGRTTKESAAHRPFEAPILWSTALLQPILIAPVTFDSSGEATLNLYNPGFTKPQALTAQAYFETGASAGSSAPVNILLQ